MLPSGQEAGEADEGDEEDEVPSSGVAGACSTGYQQGLAEEQEAALVLLASLCVSLQGQSGDAGEERDPPGGGGGTAAAAGQAEVVTHGGVGVFVRIVSAGKAQGGVHKASATSVEAAVAALVEVAGSREEWRETVRREGGLAAAQLVMGEEGLSTRAKEKVRSSSCCCSLQACRNS